MVRTERRLMALRLVVDAPTRRVSDRYEEWTAPVDAGDGWAGRRPATRIGQMLMST
jgi:hypothetical protein